MVRDFGRQIFNDVYIFRKYRYFSGCSRVLGISANPRFEKKIKD
jgi:hypothetical protein